MGRLSANLIAFIGPYGCGKSEISINYAMYLAKKKRQVTLIDLDMVTPLFRAREATKLLSSANVEVIMPPEPFSLSDMPVLPNFLPKAVGDRNRKVIIDVGGDEEGTRILATVKKYMRAEAEFWFVINSRRPFLSSIEQIIRYVKRVEAAGQISATGLVSNTNLADCTTAEVVHEGLEITKAVSDSLSLPVVFVAIPKTLRKTNNFQNLDIPILWIDRLMRPPWEISEEAIL